MLIYLLRHGQTTGDVEDRYGGDYDDHLTDLGKQQAATLADQLSGKSIEAFYSSPRLRAQEAAAIVASKLGLQVKTFNDFRERNGYGVLTGMVKTEAARQYPAEVVLLKDVHVAVQGAEAYTSFQERITRALQAISREPHEQVAIMTHGGPIRLVFRDLFRLGEIDIDDCAWVALQTTVSNQYQLLEKHGIRLQHTAQ